MKLEDKYNVAVARYTSYPPANYFESNPAERYLEVVDRVTDSNISLYFHIPFCKHLCHYCGCNSFAMPPEQLVERYVAAIHKEMDIVLGRLDKNRKVSQIHFGGGTPTALPASELKSIIDMVKGSFSFTPDAEIAIECHPAYLDREGWVALADAGFNRISIGVQDFNSDVLKSVNRHPSLLDMEHIFSILRERGILINLDFIYGLPLQSVESFSKTIERAIELSPDRIVTFSYAHVPWVNPRQMILEERGLPQAEDKIAMQNRFRELLSEGGYRSIGLDHFVKEGDELALALDSGKLYRNFQGYCTRHTTGEVYGFGVTAISQLKGAYFQNIKGVEEYIESIERGDFAYDKGYILSEDEQMISTIISTLMCNNIFDWQAIASEHGVTVDKLQHLVSYNDTTLKGFVDDGIVVVDGTTVGVTELGRRYVRNVAAALDPLMRSSKKSFSKSI